MEGGEYPIFTGSAYATRNLQTRKAFYVAWVLCIDRQGRIKNFSNCRVFPNLTARSGAVMILFRGGPRGLVLKSFEVNFL